MWITSTAFSLCPQGVSLVLGGRFNIGNDLDPSKFPAFAALYLAENYDTAYEERFGLVPSPGAGIEGHEFALRQPGSFTSVNVTGHVLNLFDLRSAINLKKFVEVVSGFEMPKELRKLARSVGMSGPLLADTNNLLRKTLLAHNWRMYPSQYEIPANPQVFGRLLLDAGFDGVIYPSTKGPKNCVALFPSNFARSDSYVEVADQGPPNAGVLRLDSSTWQDIAAPPDA